MTDVQTDKASGGQAGFTLVPVLWTVTLLALIVTLFLSSVRTHTQITANSVDLAHAQALAETGITLGVLDLLASTGQLPHQRRYPMGQPVSCVAGSDGVVTVEIDDEGGKADLNFADTMLLQRIFTGLGYSRADASRFADTIADYRDSDDLRRLNGAEAADYHRAGLAYGPANGPFTATEELGQVLGLPRELVARLLPMVTVHSGSPSVDLAFAPTELASALAGGIVLTPAASTHNSSTSGRNAFTIHSRGLTTGGMRTESAELVSLTPGARRPFVVRRWIRNAPAAIGDVAISSVASPC